jgi:PKD repeat protein/photosystem II stability/assembly factor-like uncharacterized protein
MIMVSKIYKNLLQTCLFLFLTFFIFSEMAAQPWNKLLPQEKLEQGTLTLFDYQDAFNNYWEPLNVENGYYEVNGVKQKAGGWKQFKRWEWYWEQRVDQKTGEFPKTSAKEAYEQYLSINGVQSGSGNWTSMGPSSTSGGYAGLGRLNAIGFHPTDANTFYVGAAAGGIWKTDNGGSTWTPLSDTIPALGISDIEVTLDGANEIIYIATGDRDHSDTYSVGMLKSTDGGLTWNETGLTWTQSQQRLINRTLIDTDAPDTLYAATSIGLYQTIDGGTNWSLKYNTEFVDIEFQPGNTAQLYGSTWDGKIYRSTNYGDSWTQVYSVSSGERTEIAVTADNDDVIYAIMANSSNGLQGIHKSVDGGATFSQVFNGNTTNLMGWDCDGDDSGGQGWYDLCIESDPNDEDVVFVGGVNTWGSTDGGSSWDISGHWSGTCGGQATTTHADKHFLAYQNGTSTLFECNDGGVYKTSNTGNSWTHLGSGLVISQMYRFGTAQTTNDDVITGLQDNGTKALLSGSWNDVIGGDGMDCLIDYTDENVQYGSLYYGRIYRTTNHWASDTRIDDNGISESGAWVTPYCLDKNDNETIYAGFQNVWKSTNRGNSWTKISTWGNSSLRSIAGGYDSDYIYAATYNTIYSTTDGGTSWTNISSGLPGSSITFISVSKDDPNTVWVSLSGFNSDGVYETTDGGSSWTNISSGLPQLPVNCVTEDTSAPVQTLYAGTDVGIYIKVDDANWSPFFEGLPNVNVTELEIYYNSDESDSRIRAATFGRGLWESPLYTSIPAPVTDFVADNTTPSTIDTVQFTDLSVNTPSTWDWEITPDYATFVDGTDSESQNPRVRFDAPGFYTVSLTTSNAAGSHTETKVDYIEASGFAPETDFVADTTITLSTDPVAFTDLSLNTPTSWDWDVDPTTITYMESTDENSQNPVIRFNEAGFYSVTLTASNATGSDSETKENYIEVVDILSVVATAEPEEFCAGDTTFLAAHPVGGNGNYTYSWTSNPIGFASDEQYPFAVPLFNTTYIVQVTDGVQENSGQVSVIVNELPEITLVDWPEEVCNEQEPPIQLTALPEDGTFFGTAVTPEGIFSPEVAPLGWNVISYVYVDESGCQAVAQDSIFVDECVGISENLADNDQLVVYPNPNRGNLTIESKGLIQTVELVNQLGVVIFKTEVNSHKFNINKKLDKGIYYLKVDLKTGNQVDQVNKKVMIR